LSEVNASLRDINERHQKELHEARAIQSALLPKALPTSDLFEVAAIYQPLDEVGGDFYTIETTQSGQLRILSADVTGHGLPAAFIGSMTKLALVAVGKDSPGDLLFGMNALMAPIIPQGRFVTANAYSFHPSTGQLDFARAGGPQALLFNAERSKFEEVKGDGFPLGFFEEGEYPTGQLQMEKNDVFVVVTDGITEAQNRDKQFFGFEGIVKSVQKTKALDSAQVILDTVMSDFNAFLDGRLLKDDVTVLVLVRR
jgi:sigma-B regulation protein RsbU (phosphoserine phosphatase)